MTINLLIYGEVALRKRWFITLLSVLVIVVLVPHGDAFAKVYGKISGMVEDANTGGPIVGATVRVLGTSLTTITDEDGEYFFLNVPVGKYDLAVTHVGFEFEKEKGKRLLVADSVKGGPREVTEGKAVDYVLKEVPEVDLLAYKYICICDATGRTHRRKLMETLPKDKRKLLRRPTPKETQTA